MLGLTGCMGVGQGGMGAVHARAYVCVHAHMRAGQEVGGGFAWLQCH